MCCKHYVHTTMITPTNSNQPCCANKVIFTYEFQFIYFFYFIYLFFFFFHDEHKINKKKFFRLSSPFCWYVAYKMKMKKIFHSLSLHSVTYLNFYICIYACLYSKRPHKDLCWCLYNK